MEPGTNKQEDGKSREPPAGGPSEFLTPNPAPVRTRRRFLGSVGKKAVFIAPIVWTLTARQARAAGSNPSSPSCVANGGVCADDSDCCSGNCPAGTCVP